VEIPRKPSAECEAQNHWDCRARQKRPSINKDERFMAHVKNNGCVQEQAQQSRWITKVVYIFFISLWCSKPAGHALL
jgi:hypothetical protein